MIPISREQITFSFDGEAIPAVSGQSIGAALIAAGHRSWRRTRFDDAPRGIFCGIGICFDCLVTVNDRPSRRACLVEVRPGDVVSTQQGAGHADLLA
ncbi:(2Fe-2S)-binding protein [Nakamurella sp. PAMC28650]|uniref:(2Fe-2S)-binding protein n=1 Tax=Nakamurella sp. PAMC28650 TaxID=2762325 RepID=UPI001C9A3BB9|nr:(2Fe-2S)-binding protein [Nakamurella sp. PAMC28650]